VEATLYQLVLQNAFGVLRLLPRHLAQLGLQGIARRVDALTHCTGGHLDTGALNHGDFLADGAQQLRLGIVRQFGIGGR
jgi:hypothetical protein